jgi:cobalt-zinc-cadmium efflux system outer membrane protein
LLGCAGALPEVDPAGDSSAATAIADAVVFHSNGEEIDAATVSGGLSLAEALQLALRHDPRLQRALAEARGALAAAAEARKWPNPVLDFSILVPNKGVAMIESMLTVDVVKLLTTGTRAAAADASLRGACAAAVAVALDVVAETEVRFASAQAGQARLQLLQRRLLMARQLVDLARARSSAGEGSQLAILELDALRIELELDLADRSRELHEDRLMLLRLCGAPSLRDDFTLPEWTPLPPTQTAEERLVAAALRQRPEVQVARRQVDAAEQLAALAGWAPFEGTMAGFRADRDDGWRMGPTMSVPVPLFDGGGSARDRAAAMLSVQSHVRTQVLRQIVEEVRIAFAGVAAATANLERVRSELLPLQERRRTQAEAMFRAGQTDATPLLLAEQDLLAASTRRVELERDVAVQHAKLVRAVGGTAAFVAAERGE